MFMPKDKIGSGLSIMDTDCRSFHRPKQIYAALIPNEMSTIYPTQSFARLVYSRTSKFTEKILGNILTKTPYQTIPTKGNKEVE